MFERFFEFVSSLGNTPFFPPELASFLMGLFKLSVVSAFTIIAVSLFCSLIFTSFKDFRK